MKEFLKADPGINKLFEMVLYTPMYSKTLVAGIELDVFSALTEPKKHTQVAKELSLHPENTGYLLDALTSIELLDKKEGLYQNTALSNKHLVKSSDQYIGAYLKTYNITAGYEDVDIVKLVQEGPGKTAQNKEKSQSHAEMFGDYTEMLKSSQKAGRAKEVADLVASLPEFSGFQKMLDLGGGPGLISTAVVQAHPSMKGVIFETPAFGKAAQEAVNEYNMENRVHVLTGDFTKDSLGEGYDLILSVGSLNFAKHALHATIKKIYDALNPKGVFLCISEGLTHEKTKPKEMAMGWLPGFLNGRDFSLEQGEISDAALRCGFRSVYKRTMNLIMGTMDVDIARK
jgi:predicted TPR repeat methyltransferase